MVSVPLVVSVAVLVVAEEEGEEEQWKDRVCAVTERAEVKSPGQ